LEDDLDRNLLNLIKSLIRKKPHRDIKLPEGEFESVDGFIIHLLGKIPKVGEQIVFEDLEMTIKSADVRKSGAPNPCTAGLVICDFFDILCHILKSMRGSPIKPLLRWDFRGMRSPTG